jgi:long-chain acyl-CoA synthetase
LHVRRHFVIMRDMPDIPESIDAFFDRHVVERRNERALGFIRAGELHWRSWHEISQDRATIAAVLRTAGLRPGDRVAHISENRYEWIVTDLAIHLVGAVHVPMHVTLSGEQIAAQVADCGAALVIVSNRPILEQVRGQLPVDAVVWVHDEQGVGNENFLRDRPRVARDQPPTASPDDLATILYTSGTTGRPRGVMLSQRNLASNAAAVAAAYGGGRDETRLCILPLSHIYARTCDLYTWLYRGSQLVIGESRETLARDLQLARPTALNAVPFVYQRIADQIRGRGCRDEPAALRGFFGGRIERPSCGGAPLAPDVEAWYEQCGLPIHCGYGLTEASPVISVSAPGDYQSGSVGRPLANVDVRIAEDGEVLARGPNIM